MPKYSENPGQSVHKNESSFLRYLLVFLVIVNLLAVDIVLYLVINKFDTQLSVAPSVVNQIKPALDVSNDEIVYEETETENADIVELVNEGQEIDLSILDEDLVPLEPGPEPDVDLGILSLEELNPEETLQEILDQINSAPPPSQVESDDALATDHEVLTVDEVMYKSFPTDDEE